jgi:hypothetical protein
MKGNRKRRAARSCGLSVAILGAAAATAVALSGGDKHQDPSSVEVARAEGGAAPAPSGGGNPPPTRSAGHPRGSADGAPVAAPRKSQSEEAESDPPRKAVADARVAALEQAPRTGPHRPRTVPRVPYHARVAQEEVLPCTSPREPANFEVFSAGPAVAGVPLAGVERRCGAPSLPGDHPENFVNYIYGRCEISKGGDGCMPPLEIQTWPACQRALADYSFGGEPVAYKRLPDENGAEVVEILLDGRIEVYTGESTIVVFSENPALAEKAVTLLRAGEEGQSPPTHAGEIEGKPEEGLAPPVPGATEGELSCRS